MATSQCDQDVRNRVPRFSEHRNQVENESRLISEILTPGS